MQVRLLPGPPASILNSELSESAGQVPGSRPLRDARCVAFVLRGPLDHISEPIRRLAIDARQQVLVGLEDEHFVAMTQPGCHELEVLGLVHHQRRRRVPQRVGSFFVSPSVLADGRPSLPSSPAITGGTVVIERHRQQRQAHKRELDIGLTGHLIGSRGLQYQKSSESTDNHTDHDRARDTELLCEQSTRQRSYRPHAKRQEGVDGRDVGQHP